MSRKHHLIDINIKNILYMLILFKFNYISYQIEKNIIWINKIYLYVHTNLITDFLIIGYIFIIICKTHIIYKIKFIYNVHPAQDADLNLVYSITV